MIEQLTEMPTYEAYKDSGVEWLGEIPAHWEIKRLKNLTKINPSFTFFNHNDEIACFLPMDMVESNGSVIFDVQKQIKQLKSGFTNFQRNDVIVAKITPCFENGKGACLDKMPTAYGFGSTEFHVLRVKKLVSPKYIYYLTKTHLFMKLGECLMTGSAGQKRVPSYFLSEFHLASPSFHEQTAIAAFLDRKTAQIDQAVAIKEQQIALLKERKQILIQNAVTRGLDPNVTMRDSGVEWIGEIPEHWKLFRVKNVFRLVIEPAEKNNDHELLSIYTDIGVKPRKELEEKGNKASTTDGYWLVKKGDFIVNKLLAWMGAIGLSEYEGVTSPAYDILRPIKAIDGYFYHYLFRTKNCTSELKKHSKGIMEMRLRLYFDKFGVVEIPYPSKEEQSAIVTHISTQSAKIDQTISIQQQQIDKLKEYKATLINSAVTGKIRVEGVAA